MTITADFLATDSVALDLDDVRIDPTWALKVPSHYAIRKCILPLCKLDTVVIVACAQIVDAQTQKALRSYLKCDFEFVKVSMDSLRRTLARVYDSPSIGSSALSFAVREAKDEGDTAVATCDELLQAAILRGASDVHLLPTATSLNVQLRVDGQLELYRELPLAIQPLVLSRLKVLAGMDIAEKRAAQDGRISSRFAGARNSIDIRVATLPTRYGERMTLPFADSARDTVIAIVARHARN